MKILTKDQIFKICREILLNLGAADQEARICAEHLMKANLRGVDSHGIRLLLQYTRRIQHGLIKLNANVRVIKETSCTALIDGDNGLGQVAGVKAMELAIEKANENGVSVVSIRNTNHLGMMCYYPMMAMEKDKIGFATCTSAAVMAPWGGKAPLIGNDPIAFAIPAGKNKPIIYDGALSVVAAQKIEQARIRGEKIPYGWGFDAMGQPTTDPSKIRGPKGLIGTLAPIGGYKGYGLSVGLDILAAALSGANFSKDTSALVDLSKTWNAGCFMMVIDIEHFVPVAEFKRRVDELVNSIKNSPLKEGFDEILLPGEKELKEEEKRMKEGIPLDDDVWTGILNLAEELKVKLD